MTDISFYHLTSTSLDDALPKLLEKSLQAGFRVQVKTADEVESERLASWLWNYSPDTFLPHGTTKDGLEAEQPIFISSNWENRNAATLLLVLAGEVPPAIDGFTRMLDMFNGADAEQTQQARTRWKQYSTAGNALTYFRQTPSGSWEKQS